MFEPVLMNNACGWVINQLPMGPVKKKLVSHDGDTMGFHSTIWRLTEDKHTIILMNNTPGEELGKLAYKIARILYNQPPQEEKPSIVGPLLDTLNKKGIAAAIKKYHQLKSKSPDRFNADEKQLNLLGIKLIREGKVKESIEIFKLNVSAFPKSDNASLNLGIVYLKSGNTEKAKKKYKKAVELNTAKQGAAASLKEHETKK